MELFELYLKEKTIFLVKLPFIEVRCLRNLNKICGPLNKMGNI